MRNSRLPVWSVLLFAALIASVCVPCPAFASAPPLTSIQGILTDAAGTPLPDGSYNVTLRLYDQAVGGNLLFTEYKPIVTEDGLFTTELGAAAYADDLVFANPSNWLEVQIDGQPAMSPRIRLTSAPYARSTSQWHTIPGGVSSLGRVGINTQTPQVPLHVSGDGELVRLQSVNPGAASNTILSFVDNADVMIGWVGDGSSYNQNMYLASSVGDIGLFTPAGTVLTVTAGGNVGVGTDIPTEKLQVGDITNGSIALTGNLSGYPANTWPTLKSSGLTINFDAGGVWTGYVAYNSGFMDVSDKSMKDDIRTIDGALEKVSQINGVKFKWADNRDRGQDHIGVIAQDVEKVAPELVGQPEGMGVKAVNYGGLNALTIEAIKELKTRVEQLEAELAQLKRAGGK